MFLRYCLNGLTFEGERNIIFVEVKKEYGKNKKTEGL